MRLSFSLIVILLFPIFIFSRSIQEDQGVKDALNLVEKWIESQMSYDEIPGVSMAIVYKDEVIWKHAMGYSDLEKKTPMETNTVYSICSISKLFTSIALMQLRDQGKIRLDDPVSKHLTWFKIEQVHPDSPPITIESILTHSAGLPRESDYPYWNAPNFDFPAKKKMIEQLKNQKTLYPAFAYYQYSNLGLTLAGEIVAEISGIDYASYVSKYILKPLGLNDTRPYMPEDLIGEKLATGYSAKTREGNRDKMSFFQADAITPAAGFSSTAEDLARFALWQIRLLETRKEEVLKANTLNEMYRVHFLDPDWETTRGLGFGVYRNNGITFVGHSGSCPGYRSTVQLQVKDKIAVIFMANSLGVNVPKYAQNIYRVIAPALKGAGDSSEKSETINPDWIKFTSTYTYDPWGGEVAVVPWNGELAMAYFPSSSPPINLEGLRHVKDNLFVRVREDGEDGEEIEFIFGDDGKVKSIFQHSNYWKKIK
jgi:CubicO group peptidase (beta-lactamase class C family)